MNPYQVIEACSQTNSSKEKVRILQENDSEILRFVLEYATSPFIVFGVKKFEFEEPVGHYDFDMNLNAMKHLLNSLHSKRVRSDAVLDFIKKVSANFNYEQQEVLRKILLKDLECGVGTKTINSAFPGLIPEFTVQLAQPEKKIDKIRFPCIAEIKKNGRRNIAIVHPNGINHYSRNGKEHPNYHCFDEELSKIAGGLPIVFDGEVSGKSSDSVLSYKSSQEQARRKHNVNTDDQIFTVFDVMPIGEFKMRRCDRTQKQRSDYLKGLIRNFQLNSSQEDFRVRLSKTKTINNMEELQEYYEKVVNAGHEGLVVKNLDGLYEFKRSNSWVKMKVADEIDLPIVDVVEGQKSRKNTLGSIIVEHKGTKVHCGPGKGVTIEDLKQLWKERKKIIGMTASVVYMNETPDGSLYLAKFISIRDDK